MSVAPYAGAWIESDIWHYLMGQGFASLPMRERGLKAVMPVQIAHKPRSLPMRERGLKASSLSPASVQA
ncbi:Uncharacterised protein [Paenibacillus macerans]|uniref:Uncharacterized protein n=1 Tax=Paenibacillus macerans TaxID=44252 RepID=A0A090Z9E5_PAEMA|nr:hypothetical protein DJ90_4554 [Paenibacillus macerans]SUA85865.1 Uncharacterised protein [Paenibacillus macerans]